MKKETTESTELIWDIITENPEHSTSFGIEDELLYAVPFLSEKHKTVKELGIQSEYCVLMADSVIGIGTLHEAETLGEAIDLAKSLTDEWIKELN